MSRLQTRFAALKREGRAAFIPFVTAGDPDYATSLELLKRLPAAGADVIEIGVPFSDPMADGPAIQASSLRALHAGMTVEKTLALVRDFRAADTSTAVVLMGYLNPIHAFGIERFAQAAAEAGVDGLITVDLPPSSAWQTRTQTLSVLGSANGTSFSTIVASATYTWNPSTGNTVTIPLPAGTSDQYVELSYTANSVQNGAQASEIEIFS